MHYDVTPFHKLMHKLGAPLKWVWWRTAEILFRIQFNLSGDRVPKYPLEIDVFSGGQILNYDYRDALKAGTVKDKKGAVESFTEKGIVL